jgi:hypothetical protein
VLHAVNGMQQCELVFLKCEKVCMSWNKRNNRNNMYGATIKNSAHSLFECEDLGTHGRTYLGFLFLGAEDVTNLNLGAIWNFIKRTGLP